MIVDSSAVLAILLGEPDAQRFADAISDAMSCRMPAPTWFETSMNVDKYGDPWMSRRLDDFIEEARIERVAFTRVHADRARRAWQEYGRGNHPAKLNFGDCMVYALAKLERAPLLFKGNDFSMTDIEPALKD